MGNKGRGRGHSSGTRGRGQSSSLNRIRKSSSPAAKTPAIVISSALDPNKLSSLYVPRSPIRTRASTSNAKQQPATASGKQQPSGDGGPSSSSSNNSEIPAIPTANKFDVLSDSDDDDTSIMQQSNNDLAADKARQEKIKKCSLPRVRDRPPMIHVVDTLATVIDDLLLPLNVQYFIKVTKVAVQILAVDNANYTTVLNVLKLNNVKYFTYGSRDQKLTKIVLQGLPEMEISEVMEELKNLDFTPREVKVLSRKTTATGTHMLYLIYFEKGTVKIQDLRLIKCLSGYLVNWRFFTKRPSDAAQCHRCQKFGHGSRHCNLTPRCVKCGMDHLTDVCPLPRKANLKDAGNAEQHKPSVKCANCGGNHTANFRGCTFRKSYIEQQEKKRNPPVTRHPASSSAKPAADRSSAYPPGWGRSYANIAASGLDAAPAADDAAAGDLFSLTEFLILARDMFRRLSSCRNKQQQFMALSELMMKYVCAV